MSNALPEFPVKYVLYTHYQHPRQRRDFSSWQKGRANASQEKDVQFLVEHFNGLRQLLTSAGFEGLIVLFYDPGFAKCLEGIGEGKKYTELLESTKELQFAEKIKRAVNLELKKYGELVRRVRFVTALDLYKVFWRWNEGEKLRWWFIGRTEAIRYDTPKIVEAIVRVRLLGTGVPVFRVDWDVLFLGDENKNLRNLGLFEAIATSLKADELRRDDPRLSTYLFSSQYDTENAFNPKTADKFDSWCGAFATRVFPALAIDEKRLKEAKKQEKKEKERKENPKAWDKYAEQVFNVNLARQFYGFTKQDKKDITKLAGLAAIGAHPTVSVISGAFLRLSESAIIDLPPFSNFRLNVSWIDDHLKYCLHRELRHMTTVTWEKEPRLSDAKIDSIMVKKKRAPITNLPAYVLGNYLPTLLWGTVMDAWITAEPLLKFRPEPLSKKDRKDWDNSTHEGESKAVLPKAFQMALKKGSMTYKEKEILKKDLEERALVRINEVRKQWANLATSKQETFASIWAKGVVRDSFPEDLFPEVNNKCLGITPNLPLDTKLTSANKLDIMNPHLWNDLRDLIDDAIEYIEWTIHWPAVTQVIRSVEPGTLETDLPWPRKK